MITLRIRQAHQSFGIEPEIVLTVDGDESCRVPHTGTVVLRLHPGNHNLTFTSGIQSRTVPWTLDRDTGLFLHWDRRMGDLRLTEE